MKTKNSFAYLTIMIVLITGCNFDSMYESTFAIEKGAWKKSQVVTYDIPVKDSINGYNVFINVRNSNDYPYSNLFLFVATIAPNGSIRRDTVEFFLADSKGKWLGSGIGGLFAKDLLFRKNIRFPILGNYRLEIIQAMRDDVLEGINDVGIKVERSK